MNVPLRVGVIGLGARSSIAHHLTSVTHPAVLVGGCDPSPATRGRTARTLRGRQWVATLGELLSLSIDAVIITSPNNTREGITCSLLEAGVVIFLEKLIVITIEGADRILETVYRTCTPLYVGHNMRHMDVVRMLRRVIQKGRIDEVETIWCRRFVGNGSDYYFKDWHASHSRTTGLLLQKTAYDIDIMSWLSDSVPTRVVVMGDLMVYRVLADRSGQNDGAVMEDWFSSDSWPPETQIGLNPIVDVEDLSILLVRQENGAMTSHEQCHFIPDYWHNYIITDTHGRAENFGDGEDGSVRVQAHRSGYEPVPDLEILLRENAGGHGDTNVNVMNEFTCLVVNGDVTDTTPLSTREAVAAGVAATTSLRGGDVPMDVPRAHSEIVEYFNRNQLRQHPHFSVILHIRRTTISCTYDEIVGQPDLQRYVAELSTDPLPADGEYIAVVGCGISRSIARAYTVHRERAGKGAGDIHTATEFPWEHTFDRVVCLSRSGMTMEIIQVTKRLHEEGRPTLLITAVTGGLVAEYASEEVVLDFADKTPTVQIRSATNTLQYFLGSLGYNAGASTVDAERALAIEIPSCWVDVDQISFLGMEWTIRLATETGLKLRETSQSWTEVYPVMEYRHGPVSTAQPGCLTWVLDPVPDGLAKQVHETGTELVTFDGRPIAHLVLAQCLAVECALARGLNPDTPRNLTRPVILP